MWEKRSAPSFAMHNRGMVESSRTVGCYFCGKIFKPAEITEWVDKADTAICPYCEVDAVLPERPGFSFSTKELLDLRAFWFSV
jgi:hypothetical protein